MRFFPSTFPCLFEWPSYDQCKTFQILENKALRRSENRIIASSDIFQVKYIHIHFVVVSQVTAEHTQHAGIGPSADHKQSKSEVVQLHVCNCTKHSWSAHVYQAWSSQNHTGLAVHTQTIWVMYIKLVQHCPPACELLYTTCNFRSMYALRVTKLSNTHRASAYFYSFQMSSKWFFSRQSKGTYWK